MTPSPPHPSKLARAARFGVVGAVTALTVGTAFARPAAADLRGSAWVAHDVLNVTGTVIPIDGGATCVSTRGNYSAAVAAAGSNL